MNIFKLVALDIAADAALLALIYFAVRKLLRRQGTVIGKFGL